MGLMKKVARRVALNLSEAKRFSDINRTVFGIPPGAINQRWMFRNIFATLPSATGGVGSHSWTVVGNEIVDPLMKFKCTWTLPYGGTIIDGNNFYGTEILHVYLVAANDNAETVQDGAPPPNTLIWSQYPAQFGSDDIGWFLNQDGFKPTLNGNNCKVLKKWTKRYHPEIQFQRHSSTDTNVYGNGAIQISMSGKYRWKRKLTYEDNAFADIDANFLRSGVLRGWNYYMLVGWGAPGTLSVVAQPSCNLDMFLYFKDP